MNNFLKLAIIFLSATSLTTGAFAGRNDAVNESIEATADSAAQDTDGSDDSTIDASATAIDASAAATAAQNNPTTQKPSSGFSGGALALAGIGGIGLGILATKKGVVDKVVNKVKEAKKAVVEKVKGKKATVTEHEVTSSTATAEKEVILKAPEAAHTTPKTKVKETTKASEARTTTTHKIPTHTEHKLSESHIRV